MMKILTLFLLLPCIVFSQDWQVLMQEAVKAEAFMNDDLAFEKYQQVVKLHPASIVALCRSSELASKIGHRHKSKEIQTRHYQIARAYAARALKLDRNSAEANFVMSVAMGRLALVSSGKDMISYVKDIKTFADRAVQLAPNDFRGYHVLGKWYYEISHLGSFKRTAVKVFYGAFPEASYSHSINAYEKSRQLNPAFNLNYLELAKVYNQIGQKEKAISLLQTLNSLPVRIQDDIRVKREALRLQETISQSLRNS
ncbi:hypothetical protein [Flavihumibacter sp.]|uniref:hypothetical protein n=1 Tax=Flavihumibacter sp. TaxID=1913981 RepID=UPI002FC921A9